MTLTNNVKERSREFPAPFSLYTKKEVRIGLIPNLFGLLLITEFGKSEHQYLGYLEEQTKKTETSSIFIDLVYSLQPL
jgi:hypothetical protein